MSEQNAINAIIAEQIAALATALTLVTEKLAGVRVDSAGLDSFVGERILVRTESTGIWYGTLKAKSGSEVIMTDSRRLYDWRCAKGISVSSLALYGVVKEGALIVGAVPEVWLTTIEMLKVSEEAQKCFDSIPEAEQQQ